MAEINDLLVTDASNTARWPEGMAARQINDSMRAVEGYLGRYFKDTSGQLLTTGTSTAYQIVPYRTFAALANGMVFQFRAHIACGDNPTLQVGGLTATALVRAGGQPVLAGDIAINQTVLASYNGTLNKFECLNISPTAQKAPTLAVVSASTTYTVPAGCVAQIVRPIAGGGGGGGATGASSQAACGGAGGGGGFGFERLTLAPGDVVACTVGTGGAGGASDGSNGAAGGSTSFGAYCSASGGGGGVGMLAGTAAASASGGAGGTGSGGSVNAAGTPGGSSLRVSGTVAMAGSGGASVLAGGGRGRFANEAGAVGNAPGSGGAGGCTVNGTSYAGGNGADGMIIIEEYYE